MVSFDLNMNTMNEDEKKMEFGENDIGYFVIYEFELNDAKCIDIGEDVLPFDVCFDGNMDNVNMYFQDGLEHKLIGMSWKNDDEWNAIYKFDAKDDHFKKCVNVDAVSICLENKRDDLFFVELKLP